MLRPGDAIGAYRLEGPLGEGGMKQVWRARTAGGGAVALAILAQFDPDRFVHEVTLAGRVASPQVARVLEGFITDDGRGVVVSELCDGLDLARYRQARKLSPGEAVALVAEMAAGLAAIHAAHVLHRDVKPSNAMLTRAGVKLIDFGVSLPATDARTGPECAAPPAGTLPYMAPETVRGELDARTDTYALGVSLFHLLAGHPPLPFVSPYGWLQRLADAEPLPLDDLAHLPVVATAMVARLCTPERDRRPFVADAIDRLRALARSLDGALPPFLAGPGDGVAIGVAIGPGEPGPATGFIPPPAPAAAPPPGDGTDVDLVPAPERFVAPRGPRSHAQTMFPVPLATPSPGCIVVGWPHLPLLALCPADGGTLIRGLGPTTDLRDLVHVADRLLGGLVADLDGDGVGELFAWSATRVHVIDAAGRLRASHDLARRPGRHPWDDGALAPVILGEGHARVIAAGDVELDGRGELRRATGGFEGRGDQLVDAAGTTGLSAHGAARQRFRGDVATPAAILTRPGAPGFVVAALERTAGPTVRLGLWGPGGRRVGTGDVGRYAYETAPIEVCEDAERPETALFDPRAAPLAVLGREPAGDTIVVPYLHNAPWFGPVLVAFDGTGAPRWREKLPALDAPPAAPPILVDLDGAGPELVWSAGRGRVERRDVATGLARTPLRIDGAPIAALDLGGRGVIQLVSWTPGALVLSHHGACLPGAVQWLPTRGDLWRSGTVGPDGLTVGPRA